MLLYKERVRVITTVTKQKTDVFVASNGVKITIKGEINIESLTRSMYGLKQNVTDKDK